MQCEEWADANSELFKEAHDETVHKNSYKRKLYELISASVMAARFLFRSLHGTNSSMKAEMRRSGAPCPVLKNFKPIGFL